MVNLAQFEISNNNFQSRIKYKVVNVNLKTYLKLIYRDVEITVSRLSVFCLIIRSSLHFVSASVF